LTVHLDASATQVADEIIRLLDNSSIISRSPTAHRTKGAKDSEALCAAEVKAMWNAKVS
jgi:hypothetical protein